MKLELAIDQLVTLSALLEQTIRTQERLGLKATQEREILWRIKIELSTMKVSA